MKKLIAITLSLLMVMSMFAKLKKKRKPIATDVGKKSPTKDNIVMPLMALPSALPPR